MFKKSIALLMCAVMLFAACGCSMMVLDTEKDRAQVVATVFGEDITKGEVVDEFEKAFGAYQFDEETRKIYIEYMLDTMVDQKVLNHKVEEMALALTEEELAEIDDEIATLKKNLEDSVRASLGDQENFEEKVAETLNEYYEMYGLNDDTYRDDAIEAALQEKLRELIVEDVKITEEDAKAEYDTLLEAQKKALDENAEASISGVPVYNAPGRRYVKNLLIEIDEEAAKEIDTLTAQKDEEGAKKKLDEALAAIKEEAEDVLAQAKKGKDFDKLIEKYGDDAGAKENPEGYIVYKGCTKYVDEFTTAAMALETAGSVSELVATDFGYHILLYASDAPSGAIAFEEVAEDIIADLLEKAQDEKFNSAFDDWSETAKITKKPNKLV